MKKHFRLKLERNALGTTLIEILVTITIAGLVFFLLFPNLFRSRRYGHRINCVYNLKVIGLGFRTYATDFNGEYPWQVEPTNGGIALPLGYTSAVASNNVFALFACISNELSTPKILRCPQDKRPVVATNSWPCWMAFGNATAPLPSYFIGVDASEEQPQSILGGDRNLCVPSAGLDFKTPGNHNRITNISAKDLTPSNIINIRWTATIHTNGGNILLGDGSVQQESSSRLADQLMDTYQAGKMDYRLLMPGL